MFPNQINSRIMKELFLSTLTIVFTVVTVQAQQGVGIGTNSPTEKLEIVGAIKIGTTTTTNAGTIRWNGTNFQGYDGSQWIDLDGQGTIAPFGTTSNVTSNENGTYGSDDFVFGSPELDYDGNASHRSRMFFDKSNGAFRAGGVQSSEWDAGNVGQYSAAFGYKTTASGRWSIAAGSDSESSGQASIAMGNRTEASGLNSVAMGYNTEASGNNSTAMGYGTDATGNFSTAFGSSTYAVGNYSTAMGYNTDADGYYSTAMGSGTDADGDYSTAMGYSTEANADYSTAMGYDAEANGYGSTAMGYLTSAESSYEVAMGMYNTTYVPVNAGDGWEATDRILVVGNGTAWNQTSNALTILKDGTMNINDAYNMPTADGTAGQIMTTDGSGSVTWQTAPADGDGDASNELQTLSITGNDVTLSNGGGTVSVPSAPFETTANVTSNENGTYSTDDFVFGAPQLDDDGNNSHRNRMFFDKSKGAFRAGNGGGIQQWDDANVGIQSVAFGSGTVASDENAVAFGNESTASGSESVAMGTSTTASGNGSTALGSGTLASGPFGSTAIGNNTIASGGVGFAAGYLSEASGFLSTAMGPRNNSRIHLRNRNRFIQYRLHANRNKYVCLGFFRQTFCSG